MLTHIHKFKLSIFDKLYFIVNKKYKTGVLIGRFQPFHFGHAWLIEKSLEKFERIIILIGSSNIKDLNNPWNFDTRKKMVEKFLKESGLHDRVIKIESVIDVPSDDKWLEIALSKINTDDFIVIGDNEWVNGIFENAGIKILRTGYFKREKYEGIKIRDLYNKNKKWEDRVPEYIVKLIKD